MQASNSTGRAGLLAVPQFFSVSIITIDPSWPCVALISPGKQAQVTTASNYV